MDNYEIDYAIIDAEARRHARIALCVKCREFHPLAADDFRHQYVRKATNGRTASSKECSLEELRQAIELVGPVLPPARTPERWEREAAARDTAPVYEAPLNLEPDGTLMFSRPRR